MGSIQELWSVARRRPLTAVLLESTTAALSVGSVLAGGTLRDYLCPSNFSKLSGDYAGRIADGEAFHICSFRLAQRCSET